MPSTRETISRTQHGDYAQVTTIDCEEGSLRVVIEGPAGGIELSIESPDDLAMQLNQLVELAEAIAAARAAIAPLVDAARGRGLPVSALDSEQLRIRAFRVATEEIARGRGDDDIEEAVADHLLTYGPDDLTLGELREIAADAFKMATAASSLIAPDPSGSS